MTFLKTYIEQQEESFTVSGTTLDHGLDVSNIGKEHTAVHADILLCQKQMYFQQRIAILIGKKATSKDSGSMYWK